MISLDEINGEIVKLEAQPASYVVIEKLALLYVVRDHMLPTAEKTIYAEVMPYGESDFLKLCQKKGVSAVMPILDEMMDTIQLIHPRLYDAVMMRLRE